jgi:hypothetical protein
MRRCLGLVIWLLLLSCVSADPPSYRPILSVSYWPTQEPAEEKNGKKEKEGEKKEEPKHIRDNAMLVEEASNQEPEDAQHIFSWVYSWDRANGARSREMAFSYTLELPICTQRHQFSFTTSLLNLLGEPPGGPVEHQGGIGDTLLNYRYQLLGEGDEFLWCSPRFSLLLPTGDERFGLGLGQLGYQFNLPVSWYGDLYDFHFNAGSTYVPHVSTFLPGGGRSPRHDLWAYNLGASVYWKPCVNFHLFVETLALWSDEIDDLGQRDGTTQLFLNPGFRYALCQLENVEWVVGLGVPIGLTRDTPDIGAWFYMSIEHAFRKLDPNGEATNGGNGSGS